MRAAPLRFSLGCVLAALALGTFATGCRPGTALHGRYDDFRAYYNAYYNAERKLDEGEEQLDRPDQPIDRTRLLSIFPEGQASRTSRNDAFQEAIDKSADLLRERATSKWADDALFVIGRAYFYKGNLVGAEQKFRETIELAEARGQSRLADEARVWLGRVLGAAERYEEGVASLTDGLAAAEGNRRERARLHLLLGELYARAGRYAEAAESLGEGVADERDADIAARAYMLLGQVQEEQGAFAEAAEAYAAALDRRPAYELGYAARLSRALVLGLDVGDTEAAIGELRRMRRDDKNFQHRAEVELAYARVLAAAGREDESRERFRDVLYDPALAGQPLRGEAHARLAEYYRDTVRDFVRAAAHYDTAATALRAPEGRDRYTRAALLDIRRTADAYTAYAGAAGRLAESDSLLALGALDDAAFEARIAAIEAQRLADYEEEQRERQRIQDQQAFGAAAETGARTTGQRQPTAAGAPRPSAEQGFLGWRDATSLQANLIAFERVWGQRPLVPNWRRRAAIRAAAATAGAGDPLSAGDAGNTLARIGLPALDLAAIPRTPGAIAEARARRAGLRYEVANTLFLSLARPDSASALYRLALEDAADPALAARTRLALAETEAALGRTDEADALYRQVLDTADDPDLLRAARIQLGLERPDEPTAEALPDSAALAYAGARRLWAGRAYPQAVRGFLMIAEGSEDSTVIARSTFAAAAAFLDWARRDSLDIEAPIPAAALPVSMRPPSDSLAAMSDSARPDSTQNAPLLEAPADAPAEGSGTPELEPNPDPSALPATLEEPDAAAQDSASARSFGGAELLESSPSPPAPSLAPPVDEAGLLGRPTAPPSMPVPVGLPPSQQAAVDSLLAAPAALPDSAAEASPRSPPPGVTVDGLLERVMAAAPGTPLAQRAEALRAASRRGTDAAVSGNPEVRAEATLVSSLDGTAPITAALGGVTWQLLSYRSQPEAAAFARELAAQDIRSGVVVLEQEDGPSRFGVIAGQFRSYAEARAVREALPSALPEEELEILPLDGRTVLRVAPVLEGE